MHLSPDDISQFARDGALIKRGLVGPALTARASALITHWYRSSWERARLVDFTQRTFAPELGSHAATLALFAESGVADIVRELVGEFAPVNTTQIQIRIPDADLLHAQPEKSMHVDGVACPHLDQAELRTFSMLVGVLLSDITDPDGGALRYVPGGHLKMADWFRTDWHLGTTDQVPPHIDAARGTPLLGECGDVLFMHHLVPHAVGRNRTSIPRVVAYFRVSHVEHATRRVEALRDPWLDYPPVAAFLRE